ncbi:RNA-binding protein 33-like isoform X2 [Nilaparvata lugens]|uniref:RNA-binding protein 33-like isoform X2 n=1 Tax=Nilaparvata lugens TaxID=108931 RepID=UPI00193E4439|nr:RNA-binding protein 33-like isoform X2 [Nilaparvata lugens]
MAEPGEELLEGELGDGDYNELDADEEEALLADDDGYSDYNLPSVSSHRDVYISSPDSKAPRKIKVEDVEDVEEGDEILDNEEDDVLELGVDGNWNLDDLDSESQEQKRNPDSKPSLFQLWIKQERVDPSEFDRNEHEEDEDKHQSLDSVITPSQSKGAGQKSPRGGGAMGRRGGTGVRRGGGQQTGEAPHHKVLINPHFKGTSPAPAPPQSHQTPPGNAQQQAQHLNQSAHQYQKQPEYQHHQHQHQPPVNSQYPHYQQASSFAPHGGPPEQGASYQNDWQNAAHEHQQQQQQQQYEQHNYTGYYEEAPAHTPPTWNSPGQPAYQNYNQSPVGQPPPPASHPMLPPPATNTMQHILTQQQPPPPGLETEFTPRKVQFSDQNKLITVQMYPESAPGGGGGMRPPHQPPGAFVQQGRPRHPPPRPPFFAPQHHQPPFRPPPHPFPPGQHPPQRMFPPAPHNQIPPRFLPRFRRGGFPRGGFPPPFRHPGGPRMMPPGPPFPPNVSHPRLPNFRQQQPVKRPHPEPKNPHHQLPFKQKKPNPNSPEKPLIAGRKRNLLEVQTVDNVPDTTTFSDQTVEIEYDEDDDEETREYKRKIAEQKRLREKLLQEKEERRKLAAVAKQKELEQRKVTSQNAPNPQATVSKPQRPANIESSQHQQQQQQKHHHQQQHQQQQPSRVSVHQRIGAKPSPVRQPQPQPQPSHALPQVTFFNDQQPAAFRMVRVRTKDGSVLIKKLPINSAGQVMLQRAAVAHAPPHMEHHQPEPQQLMMPPPQHHQQPPPPPPPQHQQFYPQQVVAPQPLPYPSPATLQLQQLQQQYQYHQPQANPPQQPVYHPPPQPVQQPFYQHQPPQTMQIHNPVPVVNSKRIVLDQPQTGSLMNIYFY